MTKEKKQKVLNFLDQIIAKARHDSIEESKKVNTYCETFYFFHRYYSFRCLLTQVIAYYPQHFGRTDRLGVVVRTTFGHILSSLK